MEKNNSNPNPINLKDGNNVKVHLSLEDKIRLLNKVRANPDKSHSQIAVANNVDERTLRRLLKDEKKIRASAMQPPPQP